MKLMWAAFVGLILSFGAAQRTSLSFLDFFDYAFRVAQTPCPAEFDKLFDEPSCYLHGYDDFFNFKTRYGLFFSEMPQGHSGYWHTVSLELGDETTTAFRSRLPLRPGRQLTVIYLGTFIVLEGLR